MSDAYAGVGPLYRLAVRRDRILIAATALGMVALVVGSAKASLELFPTPESLGTQAAQILSNPAVTAMYGPIADPTSPDAMAVFKSVMLCAIGLGLLSYGVVRRHTRTEEEDGRFELLGAGVVGRRAPLTAAVLAALTAALVAIIPSVAGMLALGMDLTGCLAFAVTMLVPALVMIGVTAVAAQLTTTARGAGAIALSFLGISFLLRALGDSAQSSAGKALTWISPIGWPEKVAAFGANRFWVLTLGLGFAAATLALAYGLLERRDLGAGLLPSRPGPDRGSIGTPAGLVARLLRGSVIGWTIAMALVGAVVGGVAGSATSMLDTPQVADMLKRLGGGAGTLLDIFFATELKFAAAAAAAAGVSAVMRLRAEEVAGRTEPVLAAHVSRPRWLLTYAAVGLCLPVWLLAVTGTVAGATARGVTGAPSVAAVVGGALATLPAVWVIVTAALVLYGLLPRWTAAAWGIFAVAFLLGELGTTMNLPSWLIKLSPFAHTPQLPGGSWAAGPLVVLAVIAVALAAVGVTGFRRRDVPA